MAKDKCNCDHSQGQHALLTEKCDNCDCKLFDPNVPDGSVGKEPSTLEGDLCTTPFPVTKEPAIVGINSHQFQGPGTYCVGVLGYSAASSRHGEICGQIKDANIHTGSYPNSGLKDSGARLQFASGMVRDVDNDKPAFDLVIPEGIPYSELMLTRWAELLRKGAIKYSRRNWEKADSDDELDRAKASAFRHFMQWFSGETDEDHAAAVFFNINEVETIKWKQANQKKEV